MNDQIKAKLITLGFSTEDLNYLNWTSMEGGMVAQVSWDLGYYKSHEGRCRGLLKRLTTWIGHTGSYLWCSPQYDDYGRMTQEGFWRLARDKRYAPKARGQQSTQQARPQQEMFDRAAVEAAYQQGLKDARNLEAARRREAARKAANARWTREAERKALAENPDLN